MKPSQPPSSQDLPAQATRELAQLLDAVPGSRQVLQHLAALEKRLAKAGLAALERLPLEAMQRAHLQLSRLPLPGHAHALRQVLALLQMAVQDRRARELEARSKAEQASAGPTTDVFRSSFFSEGSVEVRTATDSDFRRAMEEMSRRPR